MEIPSLSPGSVEKRRVKAPERREETGRKETCRRSSHDRRYDQLGRFIVSLCRVCGLEALADQFVVLSEKQLLGPVFMLVSALVAFLLYAGEKGVVVGAVIVLALMVHELGHFLATHSCRLRPHWWWFFPFIGAIMRLSNIKTRAHEATIALGGPLLGGAIAALGFVVWKMIPVEHAWNTALYQFVFLGTFLNLFNLIPLSPLDGGRITQASHGGFQWFGFVVLLALSWFLRQPVLLLVWMVIAVDRFLEYPLWRFAVALTFLIFMALAIMVGYGEQSIAEGMTYVLFGIFLVVLCRPNEVAAPHHHGRRPKVLPQLLLRERIFWGVAWIALSFALTLLLCAEIVYGPNAVR